MGPVENLGRPLPGATICVRFNPLAQFCAAAKSCFILIQGLIDTRGAPPPSVLKRDRPCKLFKCRLC